MSAGAHGGQGRAVEARGWQCKVGDICGGQGTVEGRGGQKRGQWRSGEGSGGQRKAGEGSGGPGRAGEVSRGQGRAVEVSRGQGRAVEARGGQKKESVDASVGKLQVALSSLSGKSTSPCLTISNMCCFIACFSATESTTGLCVNSQELCFVATSSV